MRDEWGLRGAWGAEWHSGIIGRLYRYSVVFYFYSGCRTRSELESRARRRAVQIHNCDIQCRQSAATFGPEWYTCIQAEKSPVESMLRLTKQSKSVAVKQMFLWWLQHWHDAARSPVICCTSQSTYVSQPGTYLAT